MNIINEKGSIELDEEGYMHVTTPLVIKRSAQHNCCIGFIEDVFPNWCTELFMKNGDMIALLPTKRPELFTIRK